MFFDKLDRLLRDRDPADKSLAAVYLTALSLGFSGKYHGLNDHGRLRRYRQELFAFVFRQPQDLKGEAKIAFPDSYVKNLREEKRRKLTNPRVAGGPCCCARDLPGCVTRNLDEDDVSTRSGKSTNRRTGKTTGRDSTDC
jgi:type VI protein secretion system component VasF